MGCGRGVAGSRAPCACAWCIDTFDWRSLARGDWTFAGAAGAALGTEGIQRGITWEARAYMVTHLATELEKGELSACGIAFNGSVYQCHTAAHNTAADHTHAPPHGWLQALTGSCHWSCGQRSQWVSRAMTLLCGSFLLQRRLHKP